jgi:hypothetical protein
MIFRKTGGAMFVLIRLIDRHARLCRKRICRMAVLGIDVSEFNLPKTPRSELFWCDKRYRMESEMKVTQFYTARHLLAGICGLIGMVLLAIGAHAALDLHASDAATAVSTEESASAIQLALIIGNSHYPDAAEPLTSPSTTRAV